MMPEHQYVERALERGWYLRCGEMWICTDPEEWESQSIEIIWEKLEFAPNAECIDPEDWENFLNQGQLVQKLEITETAPDAEYMDPEEWERLKSPVVLSTAIEEPPF